MIAGATIMIAVTKAAMRMRFLVPTTLSAQSTATMIAINKKDKAHLVLEGKALNINRLAHIKRIQFHK